MAPIAETEKLIKACQQYSQVIDKLIITWEVQKLNGEELLTPKLTVSYR